jgi:hypothetical protein
MLTKYLFANFKHMGGRIILKLILEEEVVICIELPWGCPVLGSCDHGSAQFGYQLFKVRSTEW